MVRNIGSIYNHYKIPPNLQKHMLRVTALAQIIADNWLGKKLDTDILIQACLLHDIGNIIKFNLDNYSYLLGSEEKNIEYWKKTKNEMKDKFKTEHKMRDMICNEINIDQKVIDLLRRKSPHERKILSILRSSNNELKILSYSDTRISPFGILSIQERIQEVYKRNLKIKSKHKINLKSESKLDLELEKEIQTNTSVDLKKVKDQMLETYFEAFMKLQL